MMRRIAVTAMVVVTCSLVGVGGLAGVTRAGAEEAPLQLSTPMILNLMARPLESAETAYNKELKSFAGAPAAGKVEVEVLSDGSVRYGRGGRNVTVTLRNPCPPGDLEHEMAQLTSYRELPGRGRR